MFTKPQEIKPQTINELKMNNYDDPYVKLLLNNQLKHCAASFKNNQGVHFIHIYANGESEYKEPTYEATFLHSKINYRFKVTEITNLFFDSQKRVFNKNFKNNLYDSFSLVISVTNGKELKNMLDILENEYDREKLPPILIVQSYYCKDSLKDALVLSKLGIATIIQSGLLDGVDPLKYLTWERNETIDEISQTWKELTAALHIIEEESKNVKEAKARFWR